MRFFLFGQGEGVRVDSPAVLWAAGQDGKITDASLSARKQGVRQGLTTKAAQALVPGIVLHELSEVEQPSKTMREIWQVLWGFSPWLETISEDAFLLQMPSVHPPLREVRDLILMMQKVLTKEQRFRLGLAENPFLAKVLVEWSRLERVPQAGYFKVREQELLLSPGLSEMCGSSHWKSGEVKLSDELLKELAVSTSAVSTDWVREVPVPALGVLPESIQTTLWELGIQRLGDLKKVSPSLLQQRFGKAALLWLEWLHQRPGGRVNVNYPPAELVQTRRADVGERLLSKHYPALLESMANTLARELERSGTGALKIGVSWQTNQGKRHFERVAKRPVYQLGLLLAQLQPAMELLPAEGTSQLELYVKNLEPLTSVQLTFWCEETRGRLLTEGEQPGRTRFRTAVRQREEKLGQELEKLLHQVNQKFPNGLQVGVRPTFRELRLNAVLQVNGKTKRRGW